MKSWLFLLLLFSEFAWTKTKQRYIIKGRDTFTSKELVTNFAIVYAIQWTSYYIDQKEFIEEEGSFHNWLTYPFRPAYDRDSFDYNLFKHTLGGASYYLWYRSRGHVRKDAFIWSFMSSLAFEFTIETVTERPSIQDIYQTPVFGTVLGIGLEQTSLYFHSWDNWFGHGLGYLFNPFTLLPRKEDDHTAIFPLIEKERLGVMAQWRIE